MTPEECAATLGDVFETIDGDDHVEVWRGAIAAAIRAAVLEEREACAELAQTHATVGASGLKLTPTPGEIARAIRARPAP